MLLPPELRNTIYRLVLDDEVNEHRQYNIKYGRPALLHTCKQIYIEAGSIFYPEAI